MKPRMSSIIRRNTPQRRIILEELRKVTSHPTAAEIYDIVRQHLPKISLGTVYRNLDLLVQTGVIQKVDTGAGEARFDGNPRQHSHVRCVKCGRLDDVYDESAASASTDVQILAGYQIIGYKLEYLGICPHCHERQASTDDQGACEKKSEN